MSYIGNTNTTQGFIPAIDYFNGDGSTVAFTLSRPVASVAQVQANISNVPQNPSSAFSVSGSTITFTSAPPSGTNNIYVYYTSPITQVIAPSQGTVTSESFGTITDFTTTGNTVLGNASTDTLNVGNGGLVKDASGNVGIGTSSPTSASGYKFVTLQDASPNNGAIYESLSGTVSVRYGASSANGYASIGTNSNHPFVFNANNTERARIDSSGNLLVGDTAVGAGAERFLVKSAGTSSATAGVRVINSAGTELLLIRSDGAFRTGSAAVSPYNNTLAASANCYINTDGTLLRATSSLKYKRDVQDATFGLSDVLNLRAVTYKGKNEADGENIYGGLIAEEVHASGLTQFVQYAEDGSPDALHYGNMVSLCIKAIQEQQAIITSLTDRITALENK